MTNPLFVKESMLNVDELHCTIKAKFLEFGSSDWTRTSDIRINSPPFYRLNYRGIVRTRRILLSGAASVKTKFHKLFQLVN